MRKSVSLAGPSTIAPIEGWVEGQASLPLQSPSARCFAAVRLL